MTHLSRLLAISSFLLVFVLVSSVQAQTPQGQFIIENPFSSVVVSTGQQSGKFWFASGKENGYMRYSYHGSTAAEAITSHVVFRVEHNGEVSYFCNTPDDFVLGSRPSHEGVGVPFRPYDEIYVSSGNDTLELRWSGLDVFDVTMRFVAEKPRNRYDDGADILLEFEAQERPGTGSEASLGVLLMLDLDNGSALPSGGSDQAPIVTDQMLYGRFSNSEVRLKSREEIPEFYVNGFFETVPGSTQLVPIHRMKGHSLAGALLTTPDVFAVSSWQFFRSLSWDFSDDLSTRSINDIAVAFRWDNVAGEEVVRTAFGTASKAGNDLAQCYNDDLFVAFKTARVIDLRDSTLPYNPAEFDVEMWVTNQSDGLSIIPEFEIDDAIAFLPENNSQFTLDAATPARQTVELGPRQTKKILWHFSVDTIVGDTLGNIGVHYIGDQSGNITSSLQVCGLPISLASSLTSSAGSSTDTRATNKQSSAHQLLSVYPQPLYAGRSNELKVTLQGVGGEARLSLVAVTGEVLAQQDLFSITGALRGNREIAFVLPEEITAGVYYLRLSTVNGEEAMKVVVLE